MDSFLHSRREDSSVKEREYALQSLDLSYHKYKEIVRHLDDGMQVRMIYTALSYLVPEQFAPAVLQRFSRDADKVQRELP